MSNSDSDTDSSTSTESTLTINTSDYEDLTDLDSLYSSDNDSSKSSDSSSSDSDSSCDSMQKYGFIHKLKENLFKCKNCFKIFESQNDLNKHNNECMQFFEKNYEDVKKNYINNQTFDEFVDNDTFGTLII
tara:strand:+ start:3576 stop:3968 length:393 start_codon:yes stop_codon:yes gene_type:complete